MENSKKFIYGRFHGTSEKNTLKGGDRGQKINETKNIYSIVLILCNYLDNIITIIIPKSESLVISITGKFTFLVKTLVLR